MRKECCVAGWRIVVRNMCSLYGSKQGWASAGFWIRCFVHAHTLSRSHHVCAHAGGCCPRWDVSTCTQPSLSWGPTSCHTPSTCTGMGKES
eukprot:1150046-Pelagomonas_calceolata.AAC.8